MEWNPLQHPYIIDGYDISPYGDIRYNKSNLTYKATYHSSNGYDYAPFILNDPENNSNNKIRLFPIDEIIAMVYIPVPHELCGKRLTVKHINGDNRDISLSNLEWIEDIEIWKICTYPGVKPNTYEVSNHGNVRNKISHDNDKLIRFENNGYMCCYLITENNDKKLFLEHRLVWYQFIKNKIDDNFSMVNHINDIRSSNHVRNIETADHSSNNEHAILYGQHPGKIDIFNLLLICECIRDTDGDIDMVMKILCDNGYVIKRNIIYNIIQKRTYRSISDMYFDDIYVKKAIYHQKHNKKLNNDAVETICKLLVKEHGNVQKVYDLVSDKYDVSKDVIASIRSKSNWSYISDNFFTKETYKRTIDVNDVKIICKLLVRYNGRISVVKKHLDDLNKSYISYAVIKNIKNKETWKDISDEYFSKNQYSNILSEDDVVRICQTIALHKNEKGIAKKVFDSLKENIPYLTLSVINHILYKNAWCDISDRFF